MPTGQPHGDNSSVDFPFPQMLTMKISHHCHLPASFCEMDINLLHGHWVSGSLREWCVHCPDDRENRGTEKASKFAQCLIISEEEGCWDTGSLQM